MDVPYKWIMMPNYSETEGKLIFTCHHAMYDGSVIFPTFVAMTVEQDFKSLGKLSGPSPLR